MKILKHFSLFSLLVLAACAQAPDATPTSASASTKAAATSPGKPGAPVAIAMRMLATPQPGVPVAVEITLRPTQDVESMQLALTTTPGLLLVQGDASTALGAQSAGQSVVQQVQVMSASDGTHYLNVFVTTVNSGHKLARVTALPVVIGNPVANKPHAKVQAMPGGERVISMPAAEPR